MKKEFLTFLILALGVATTAPVDAQQRAAQNRRRPQATATATATVATPATAPATDGASEDASAAPERPANARPNGGANGAPGRAGGPGFGGPQGRPGAFTLTRVRMEAIQAARGDENKIDIAKFETEFAKGAKALDGDSDGVLSTEELAPQFNGPQGRPGGPGAPGEGGPNVERRRPGRTGDGEEGAANVRKTERKVNADRAVFRGPRTDKAARARRNRRANPVGIKRSPPRPPKTAPSSWRS